MTTQFYGKAEAAATAIIDAFQNPNALPQALAPIFLRRRDGIPAAPGPGPIN